jgi:O-methyltransferase
MQSTRATRLTRAIVDASRALWLRRKYDDATMIRYPTFVANLVVVGQALRDPALAAGAIVECGTWKGGMAAALIQVGGPRRNYLFFDSFEGLPPAREIDGEKAHAWQADTQSATYYDNCSASLQEFDATIRRARATPCQVSVHKGLFSETLPNIQPPPIAVLRLDGDWYDSTMQCLDTFWDSMIPGGLIIVDDYYTWDGCTRAVHDFLSKRKAREKLRQARFGNVSYLIKEPADSVSAR